jgi:hypothetical protein
MSGAVIDDYPLLLSELDGYLKPKLGNLGSRVIERILTDIDDALMKGTLALIGGELRVSQDFVRHLFKSQPANPQTVVTKVSGVKSQNVGEKKEREFIVSERLSQNTGGTREVKCTTGYIDILTTSEVIEVKGWKDWKSAVGRVMVYGLEYPQHKKRIHLFGKGAIPLDAIQRSCDQLGVVVSYEDS